MTAAETYAVNIRSIDGLGDVAVHNSEVTSASGPNVQDFVLQTDSADAQVGDLVILGISGQETIPVKVLGIEPQQNLTAKVNFVDAAPAILTADTGSIPTYTPNITLPRRPEDIEPPIPTITDVRSEGNLQPIQSSGDRISRLIVSIQIATFEGLGLATLEARIRVKTAGQDSPWLFLPAVGVRSGSISTTEVEFEETYEVQVRSLSPTGVASGWTATVEHQVGQATILPPQVDALALNVGAGFIDVDVDVSTIDMVDADRLEIAYGTVNDREDASTAIIPLSIPQRLANLSSINRDVIFDDIAERFFLGSVGRYLWK